MPINRTAFNALVDDTGNGTSGSVWNKAAIQSVILDPADAAYAQGPGSLYTPIPVYGVWTPTSLSSGFTFGGPGGTYAKIDKVVFIWVQMIFGTGSAAACRIGGLPFVVQGSVGAWQGFGGIKHWYMPNGGSEINCYDATTGVAVADSALNGANVILSCAYRTT